MGSIPHRMCDVCKKKSLEYKVYWGLIDKISPTFELRNSGVPAVVVLACRVPAVLVALGLFALCGQSLRRAPPPALAGGGSAVVLCHPLCAAFSSVLSSHASLYFASAPLACLCAAPPGQSPAYTDLKQPWQPLQVFALSPSPFCLLLQPIPILT
jgi:hypothetical protein